eukprot:7136586-Prymnesium_polylepis.1
MQGKGLAHRAQRPLQHVLGARAASPEALKHQAASAKADGGGAAASGASGASSSFLSAVGAVGLGRETRDVGIKDVSKRVRNHLDS